MAGVLAEALHITRLHRSVGTFSSEGRVPREIEE